jgi:hypothetical protein
MAIKIATTTVITDSAKLQNFTSISGKYSSFYPNGETITTAIDMNKPIMTVELTGATTFTVSNVATGKSAILLLDTGSSGNAPTFPSTFKFAEDTEPTWTGTRYWQIGLTAWDNSTVRVIATGWGSLGGGGSSQVALPSAIDISVFSGLNGGNCNCFVRLNSGGSLTLSGSGTQGGISGVGDNGFTWLLSGSASDYECNYNYIAYISGGADQSTASNNTWQGLGSNREWELYDDSNESTINILDGTLKIRRASDQVELVSIPCKLRANHEP